MWVKVSERVLQQLIVLQNTQPCHWKSRKKNVGLVWNFADSSRRKASSQRWWLERNKFWAKSTHQTILLVISDSKIAPTSAASSTFSCDQRPRSIPTCSYSFPPVYRGANPICEAFVILSLFPTSTLFCKGLRCTDHNDKMHPVYRERKNLPQHFFHGRKRKGGRESILKHFRLWLLQIRKCTLLPQIEYRQLHCERKCYFCPFRLTVLLMLLRYIEICLFVWERWPPSAVCTLWKPWRLKFFYPQIPANFPPSCSSGSKPPWLYILWISTAGYSWYVGAGTVQYLRWVQSSWTTGGKSITAVGPSVSKPNCPQTWASSVTQGGIYIYIYIYIHIYDSDLNNLTVQENTPQNDC